MIVGVVIVAGVFLVGCAHARRAKEKSSAPAVQTEAEPKTETTSDVESKPEPEAGVANFVGYNVVLEAGGIKEWVERQLKPDDRFRVYSLFSNVSPVCGERDPVVQSLLTHRNDIDYTCIDVDGYVEMETLSASPLTIIQYSDCDDLLVVPERVNEAEFDQFFKSLEAMCSA